jgi:uncharacterized membrane protein HdeD (DUF308 family)
MERMKKRGSVAAVLLCVAELAVGILLLIEPAAFTGGVITGMGWLLALAGLWQCIRYFLMKPEDAARKQLLFRGLCLLVTGLFMALHADWILSVFPFLTMLYGLCVLLIGLRRVQWAMDMIRLKRKRWYWYAIGAALSLAVAAVILLNPFGAAAALWIFTGVALIVEAAVDALTLLFDRFADRKEKGAEPAAPSQQEPPAAQTEAG